MIEKLLYKEVYLRYNAISLYVYRDLSRGLGTLKDTEVAKNPTGQKTVLLTYLLMLE